jgi:bifunctional enzyme CysN/CysC
MSVSPATADIGTSASGAQDLLRFIACGSVDDGKSTLLGRLLFDAQAIHTDHLAAVVRDSRRWGTQGDAPDLALLFDGLSAEREQRITIDVAYRYFTTARRRFIVADAPGHEQYTRNMVTGASTADAALILVDARKGVLDQTRRHACITALLGIRHVILAVNKMDLVAWSQPRFAGIATEFSDFAARLGLPQVSAIPVSALRGDNVVAASSRMPWYEGTTLLAQLEALEVDALRAQRTALRLPVQRVNRPTSEFRGYAGMLAGGRLRPGDRVCVLPGGRTTTVTRLVDRDGDRPSAVAGETVTVVLADDVDVSRGDLIAAADAPAEVADQFETTIVWLHEDPLLVGRQYLLKMACNTVPVQVTLLKHRVNVHTLEHVAARTLDLNEIGVANIALERALAFDPYETNRDTGGFVLIDRLSNATVGAGMIHFALHRAHNLHAQAVDVTKSARARLKAQQPCLLWFTGLSGAGKSTVANLVERRLHALGRHTYLLDGDNLRLGLNRDLGFTAADRVENIRRIGEVARLMVDAGLMVLAAFISPFRAERRLARSLLGAGEFIEIFVDVPLAVAEARDPKGLYRKARRGELRNFTGIDSPYEPPEAPEVVLDTAALAPEAAAERVIALLRARGLI